jgi:WD40 repeat protein/serine/threonine protein kinase
MLVLEDHARSIFLAALERLPDQWPTFLDAACGDNAELRARVNRLLHAHQAMGSIHGAGPDVPAATTDEPIREGPGTVVGPYKLLEQIGEGGFGVVFMTEQTQPVRRKVALKVLKPGMDSRQVVARFEAERQALALMDHPNIARVFDGGETAGGRPYFVMELVKGVPITDYCDQGQLTPRERLELFIPVCRAVQHAHQKGVIHRDLKPSNVLVTLHDGTPVVKVIDFGIAKATGQQLTDKTLFTNFAQLIGTPLYMSPEQAALSGLDVDTRSDIYSLGVLLYELLTGTTPFDKERLRTAGYDEMRRIIREEEPPRPSTRISTLGQAATTFSAQCKSDPNRLASFLRGELDWVVMKCLEKDRNRRYETASGLARDVERYLHDEPVLACPPSAGYRLRKFARRNKRALATLALVGVMLVAGVAFLVVDNLRIASKQAAVDRANRDLDDANKALEANVYFYAIALAERELAANRGARTLELLDHCRPEQRGWEWDFLKRRLHEEPLVLSGEGSGFPGVAFSPNGLVLATARWDGKVLLWDPTTGTLLRTLRGEPQGFYGVAFSPDGQFLAAANWRGTVTVWDLAANQERHLKGQFGAAYAVAFSLDSRQLAACGDQKVVVWDLRTDEKRVLSGHDADVNRVIYSPDGARLATASDDQTVRLWDVRTGQPVLTLVGHRGPVKDVVFSQDGLSLASASSDRTVRLWDTTTGADAGVLTGHVREVKAVAFSLDGRRLASGSEDGTVRLWDPRTGQEAVTLRGHKGEVMSVAFSPDGRRLASASYSNLDNSVRIWNATPVSDAAPRPLRTFPGAKQDIRCLAFSPDGNRLASGGPDPHSVQILRGATGEPMRTVRSKQIWGVLGLAFSPDGTRLAASSDNGTVDVWDPKTGQEIWGRPRKISPYSLTGVAYSPDGRHLALADLGALSVRILDAATGNELFVLDGKIGSVHAVAYYPDGQRLAAAYDDQTVRVWDVPSRKLLQTLRGHNGNVTSIAYRRDGQYLASANRDGLVILWDMRDSQKVKGQRIAAHRDAVHAVAFSPDGRRLASASADGTVKLWDAATGRLQVVFQARQREVFAVAFHPGGKGLASAGADGTVKFWEVPPPSKPPGPAAEKSGQPGGAP